MREFIHKIARKFGLEIIVQGCGISTHPFLHHNALFFYLHNNSNKSLVIKKEVIHSDIRQALHHYFG